MKTLRILSAALTLGALAACPVLAQGDMAKPTDMKGGYDMSGMSAMDMYKMHWAYYNLDERQMKFYKAMGLNDESIKGLANIAVRTGLDMGYLIRRLQITGVPLKHLAVMYGVPIGALDADLPSTGMMGGDMSGGMAGTMSGSMK